MSDSDSTWPATDDFGSRFLEMDDYYCEHLEDESEYHSQPTQSPPFGRDDVPPPIEAQRQVSTEVRKNRGQRLKEYIAFEDERGDIRKTSRRPSARSSRPNRLSVRDRSAGGSRDISTKQSTEFSAPRLPTARQISLQMQRTSVDRSASSQLDETVTDSDPASSNLAEPCPTPEQLAAKQLSIARRRESAKNKVEQQKRETIERLLKVNTDSHGIRRRGRGKPLSGIRMLSHSTSTTNLSSSSRQGSSERFGENDANGGHPDLSNGKPEDDGSASPSNGASSDLPPNYIRFVSSTCLCPTNRLIFPPSAAIDFLSRRTFHPALPVPQLCSQGCGRLKRYTCSKTGRALCSLSCYKQNIIDSSDHSVSTLAVH